MICSDCKSTYLNASTENSPLRTLYGLCQDCGTEPRFGQFVSAFGGASIALLFSLEMVLLFSLVANWKWFVGVAFCIGLIVLAMKAIVLRAERVTYKSEEERRKKSWVQWIAGGASGIALTLFAVYAVIERSSQF